MEIPDFLYAGYDRFSRTAKLHSHQAYEMIYVTSGNCEILFSDGTRLAGQPGSVFEIPPMMGHERFNENVCETLFVICTPESSRPGWSARVTDTFSDHLIRQWFYALPELNAANELEQAHGLWTTLCVRLRRIRELQQQEEDGSHPALKAACDFLIAHCGEDHSIGEIARIAGVSQSHLNLLFRRKFGIGPLRWLTNERMKLARQLLRNLMFNISDVASQCGYRDIHYFSAAFKAFHGLSPSVYRRLPVDRRSP